MTHKRMIDLIAQTISELSLPNESYRHTIAKEFAWSLKQAGHKVDEDRFFAECCLTRGPV